MPIHAGPVSGAGKLHGIQVVVQFHHQVRILLFLWSTARSTKQQGVPGIPRPLQVWKCGYNHVLFRTVFCIWQSPNLWAEMIRDLGITVPITSQEDFVEWAKEIKVIGSKYHNCSEAFLWFCGWSERCCPSFFM
ncbi:hypothetical protein JVT61DRAFT_6251 [Boletus reticuloceps]|uniref:Uncharacterized protein n=1 Tax=Boletus reticuloceps TaxID=495285 RepID=A0A8I2YK34_9AGAM|nr:hypothetical protein JVT61DRAFT_6251 [Boletus reticuloceps]